VAEAVVAVDQRGRRGLPDDPQRRGRVEAAVAQPVDVLSESCMFTGAIWPRISPPGNGVLCTFTYVRPAMTIAFCSSVRTMTPEKIPFVPHDPPLYGARSISTSVEVAALAGPWMWAALACALSPA
jgi:hypothetical protein